MTPKYQKNIDSEKHQENSFLKAVSRVQLMYGILMVIVVLFGLRLFYVQVIHYNYYKNAALLLA